MSEGRADLSAGTPHKGQQFAELVEKYLGPPEYDHSPGWCQECDKQVMIDMGLRPAGMARSCEEHEPLCQFQKGARHGE